MGAAIRRGSWPGIDKVAANSATIEVANMSLGGSGYSQAEYNAIQGAVSKGVAFAVAAGNSDADANNYSPAAFDNVLTVSVLADFDGPAGRLARLRRVASDQTTRSPTSRTGARRSTSPHRVSAFCPRTRSNRAATARSAAPAWPARTQPAPLPCWRAVSNPAPPTAVTTLYGAVLQHRQFLLDGRFRRRHPEPLLDVSSA